MKGGGETEDVGEGEEGGGRRVERGWAMEKGMKIEIGGG